MADKSIDAKYLDGLTFRDVKQQKVKTEDGDMMKMFPFDRPLTPDDVLDWVDKGDTVSIVTGDGQRHIIDKKSGKEKGKAKGGEKE
jgi:hypothetical protein